MAIQKILDSIKLSAIDASKYAFREEGFISSLCAFFQGRTITIVEASTYSKKYDVTKLSNHLKRNVTSADIENAKKIHSELTNDILILKGENLQLNKILANPMKHKHKENCKKGREHQQFLHKKKAHCDLLYNRLEESQEARKDYELRLEKMNTGGRQ